MDSILTSIKKLNGIDEDCIDFDTELIIHINTVLMILTQLGVGPSEGFFIDSDSDLWEDFLKDDLNKLEAVRSYVYLKVKLVFDPPSSSSVMEAMKMTINELEWRLKTAVELM